MKRVFSAIALAALIGTPVFAAPAPTWTGFYGGVQFGGGWSDQAVDYLANDPLSASLLRGTPGVGIQPLANGYRIPQGGITGGFQAGYNWQRSNWVFGVEADFSLAGLSGNASSTPTAFGAPWMQATISEQRTDWYGTVRGRAGWLATPNLLLFGTGGFAYGRMTQSANYALTGLPAAFPEFSNVGGFSAVCLASGVACYSGSSSAVKTGWTVGGGAEWLLDSHWSAKIEYQLVDLGSETLRITSIPCGLGPPCGVIAAPSSFNVVFHNQFNVVRLGLDYHF